MLETVEQKVADFGEQASPGSWFLSKEADIAVHPALLPYSHYLRQAWEELKLRGVLCVDGRPTVYLCADVQFTPEVKRKHHSFVWIGKIAKTLEAAKLVRSIETGKFFQDNATFFPANETVDRCLIENLKFTARRLTSAGR